MNAWEHIGEVIAVAVYTLAMLGVTRRQHVRLEERLPEIIGNSLRPPEDVTPVTCLHDAKSRVITDRFVWCGRCGSIKIGIAPWRQRRT